MLSLPSSTETSYSDYASNKFGVNGETHGSFSQPASDASSSNSGSAGSPIDKVIRKQGVNGGQAELELDFVMEERQPNQQRRSPDELEYDDTDPRPGDVVHQYARGARQTAGNVS